MSDRDYKLVELVGSSTSSTDDAIRSAIEPAAKTPRHIDGSKSSSRAPTLSTARSRTFKSH